MFRVAVPDLVSNSYFPLVAAVELGICHDEGVPASIELIAPLTDCVSALRDGSVDVIGTSAHAPLLAFPEWRGVKLLCAQSQGMYWILVMRKDLGIARGDLRALRGKRIAAVPFVGAALKRLLAAEGIDVDKEAIEITMPKEAQHAGVNFGVAAARALQAGTIDGFFANAIGAEIAVSTGIGAIALDIRRGDAPQCAFAYTMPAVATTDRLIQSNPAWPAAIVRAIVKTHGLLKADPGLATIIGRKLFPPVEADLIARVIERDLPFYNATLSEQAIEAIKRYARDVGLLHGNPAYQDIVEQPLRELWNAG